MEVFLDVVVLDASDERDEAGTPVVGVLVDVLVETLEQKVSLCGTTQYRIESLTFINHSEPFIIVREPAVVVRKEGLLGHLREHVRPEDALDHDVLWTGIGLQTVVRAREGLGIGGWRHLLVVVGHGGL